MKCMENIFKERKDTKHTSILRQAKEPKGEKVHYGTKLGPR